MNKKQIIDYLYPNHKELFSFDTALPLTAVDHIITTTGADREALHDCVYAYDKISRQEGFLALTDRSRRILYQYQQMTGYDVTYTPVIDSYLKHMERITRQEHEEMARKYKSYAGVDYQDYYDSRMAGNSYETLQQIFTK